jgi:hypothetical protein
MWQTLCISSSTEVHELTPKSIQYLVSKSVFRYTIKTGFSICYISNHTYDDADGIILHFLLLMLWEGFRFSFWNN